MAELSRRDALALVARRRERGKQSSRAERPATPRHLHATLITPTFVGIAWSSVPHPHADSHPDPRARGLVYDVFRDGHLIASAHHHPLFNDHGVKPERTYRYRVRARVGRAHGPKSRQLTVRTPAGAREVDGSVADVTDFADVTHIAYAADAAREKHASDDPVDSDGRALVLEGGLRAQRR